MRDIQIRPTGDSPAVVILADISGSMKGQKIERLRKELQKLWPEIKARLITFGFLAQWVDGPQGLPAIPSGSTNLTDALNLAASAWPSEVIVISDGEPDDETSALEAAMRIPGTVSVLFIGSDGDHRGAEFMRRLAQAGGGQMVHRDLAKNLALAGELRGMLALPPPISL